MAGLAGYTCPSTAPTAGTRNTIEHCLGKCPHPCVSPPLLAAIYSAERANHHKGAYLSASMLSGGGCRKQTWYERFNDFYEVPKRRYWPFRGTLAHRIVEDAGALVTPHGWMQELRMAVPLVFDGYPQPIFDANEDFTGDFDDTQSLTIMLGGTTDAYNPFMRRLDDYKTMADAKVDMVLRGTKGGTFSKNIDDAWVWQLNIYRWLIAHTPITTKHRAAWKQHGLAKVPGKYLPAPESLHIQAIGMMEIPLTGSSYLPQRAKQPFDIDPIPVLPLDQIEAFIREQAIDWYRYLVLREEPPVLPKAEQWKCGSCPFNGDVLPGQPCSPKTAAQPLVHLT